MGGPVGESQGPGPGIGHPVVRDKFGTDIDQGSGGLGEFSAGGSVYEGKGVVGENCGEIFSRRVLNPELEVFAASVVDQAVVIGLA
jgi:hypothetical protein